MFEKLTLRHEGHKGSAATINPLYYVLYVKCHHLSGKEVNFDLDVNINYSATIFEHKHNIVLLIIK